jgi:hypothetical protein
MRDIAFDVAGELQPETQSADELSVPREACGTMHRAPPDMIEQELQ